MSIWLVMQATDGRERSFAVQKNTTIIGRETTCDVRVPVPTVSQKHCQITLNGNEIKIRDLQSERGTFHNGNRVEEAVLAHEDRLTIGPVTFVVRMLNETTADNGQTTEIIIERQAESGQDQRRLPEIVIERQADPSPASFVDGRADLSAG